MKCSCRHLREHIRNLTWTHWEQSGKKQDTKKIPPPHPLKTQKKKIWMQYFFPTWFVIIFNFSPLLFIRWCASQIQFCSLSLWENWIGPSLNWSIQFSAFSLPIQVKGGQYLSEHMGLKRGAVGNSWGTVRNFVTLCFIENHVH
jgi:hypothetical protein